MDWGVVVVQWLHVLGAVFWFGGVLFANVVVFPVVLRLAPDRQAEIMQRLLPRMLRIVEPVGVVTILLGILRGTVFGRIKSLDALATPYGLLWLFALATAVLLVAIGIALTRAAERVFAAPVAAGAGGAGGAGGPDDVSPSAQTAAARRLQALAMSSMLLFFAIFTAMILMRFS